MKETLQKKLFEKYPKIFRQKDLSKQETLMCWGFECGSGWYNLIDTLCGTIKNYLDNVNECPQVEAVQVKEKFGGLRFYYDGGDDFIEGAVWLAESMSYRICDICGSPGTPNNIGWIATRCDEHRESIISIVENSEF